MTLRFITPVLLLPKDLVGPIFFVLRTPLSTNKCNHMSWRFAANNFSKSYLLNICPLKKLMVSDSSPLSGECFLRKFPPPLMVHHVVFVHLNLRCFRKMVGKSSQTSTKTLGLEKGTKKTKTTYGSISISKSSWNSFCNLICIIFSYQF